MALSGDSQILDKRQSPQTLSAGTLHFQAQSDIQGRTAFNLGSVSRSKTSPESTASEATAVAPVCAVWCFISSRKYLSSWAKNIFDRQTQERYFPSQAVLSSLSIYLDYQLQSFPETEDYIKYTAEGEGGLKE